MVMMQKGRVVGGMIVVDAPEGLEEGAEVTVLLRDPNSSFELTPEQEEELAASDAERERGETMDAFEFLKHLRSQQSGKTSG